MLNSAPMSVRPLFYRHRLIIWLALIAMSLHALLPGIGQVHSSPGAHVVELCTAFGIKKVSSDAPSIPASHNENAHKDHCPLCAPAGAAALPAATTTLFFHAVQAAAPPATGNVLLPSSPSLLPASRGPPFVS